MGVGGKYIIVLLGILDIPGFKYNIVQNVIKVMDNKIVPIIQEMDYKAIN